MSHCFKPPLVYSCSGCSGAAQMANQMALWLDRAGEAEMSCIAGVGGGVAGLLRTARSGRAILAQDGCMLACARACLAQAGLSPDRHMLRSEHGVRKRPHSDFDQDQASRLHADVVQPVAQALRQRGDVE